MERADFMKAVDIGKRIREIRKHRKYSLRDLAELSQCSVNYLSQLERSLNSPTIETLIRITEALGIRLVDFFSGKKLDYSPRVTRGNDRESLSSKMSCVDYQILSSSEDQILLDAFLVTLEPGGNIGRVAHERKGTEFLYVLSGRLDLDINGLTYELFPGDSVCFDSGEPHQLRNRDPATVKVISVSTPPRY